MSSIFIGFVICLDVLLAIFTAVAMIQDKSCGKNQKAVYYFILALMAMNIGLILR